MPLAWTMSWTYSAYLLASPASLLESVFYSGKQLMVWCIQSSFCRGRRQGNQCSDGSEISLWMCRENSSSVSRHISPFLWKVQPQWTWAPSRGQMVCLGYSCFFYETSFSFLTSYPLSVKISFSSIVSCCIFSNSLSLQIKPIWKETYS